MTGRALAAGVVLATVAAAGPAWGYVRSRVPAGCAPLSDDPIDGCLEIAWSKTETNCVPITLYLNGFTQMTVDEVAKSMSAAAHAWSPSEVPCPGTTRPTNPFLEIVPSLAPLDARKPPVANDAHNVAVFVIDEFPHDAGVIALTTLSNKKDGRILDADIEVNARDWQWTNLDPGAPPVGDQFPIDLQAAITHEFGHFLGLGHTCYTPFGSDEVRPVDHEGNPVPDCQDHTPGVEDTVMFAIVEPGDSRKRSLTDDDKAGVCAIYPEADDPRICALDLPDDGCGCAAGGRDAGGPAAGALAFVLALGALRVSRRAR
jgi:MYXO-CTERM domain-containing protein